MNRSIFPTTICYLNKVLEKGMDKPSAFSGENPPRVVVAGVVRSKNIDSIVISDGTDQREFVSINAQPFNVDTNDFVRLHLLLTNQSVKTLFHEKMRSGEEFLCHFVQAINAIKNDSEAALSNDTFYGGTVSDFASKFS